MTETQQGLARRTFSLMPTSLGEAKEIATLIANSDFAPKDYKGKPDNVIVALQMGADLGLKPMQALQNIAVINGRPSIYGDAALALVMPVLERFTEFFEGQEGTDGFKAVCVAKRKGWPDETRREFSVADAKKANLWGKQGPWQSYPKRMLQFRARGFTLRDVGSDMLLGLVLAEEALDYPTPDATVIDAQPVPTVQPSDLLAKIPEAYLENVSKAFAELKLSTPNEDGTWAPTGLGLVKLTEFLGGDADPESGSQALLDWCRDEFAKRKTGQSRKTRTGNQKKAEAPTPPPAPEPVPMTPVASGPVETPATKQAASAQASGGWEF